MRRLLGPVVVLALLATASGCAVGPDHARPALDMPAAWRDGRGAGSPALANEPWWSVFGDQALQGLVREALAGNQDLAIAVERVVEARARVGVARSFLYPQVTMGTDVAHADTSREGFPNNPVPGDREATLTGLGLDLSWELDVFGRIRRSSESELALLAASEDTRRAVAIALVASVARTYVELRDADLRLEIAERTLETRAESLRLARLRFEGGLTSEKDPNQAEAEYFRVDSQRLQLQQAVRERENALSVLLGKPPGPVARGLRLPDMPVAGAVPAGLPSELLDRRPDVRAAEEQLHAATADVGAAKALLFPRIALTADVGTASTELDMLFTGSSQAWSVAAGLLQPVFQGGRNVRRLEASRARMRQSLQSYEKAVLQALREVEDNLVAFEKNGAQRASQGRRVEAERRVVHLATVRYQGGVADYLEVLDAQRNLFNAELDEVRAIGGQLSALIDLYRSLGGGWPVDGAPGAAPSAAAPATGTQG